MGLLQQLERIPIASATARAWIGWGFAAYVTLHILLYRPHALFRAHHRMFSAIATGLFGGNVTSVEEAGGRLAHAPSRAKRSRKPAKGDASNDASPHADSPLVAFSPYVIPLYTLLVCVAGWLINRWGGWPWTVSGACLSALIGVTAAFHWLMTADDLQAQRERWPIETYLLALGVIFLVTLLIDTLALSWVLPEFAPAEALGAGWSRAHALYTTLIQRLFL